VAFTPVQYGSDLVRFCKAAQCLAGDADRGLPSGGSSFLCDQDCLKGEKAGLAAGVDLLPAQTAAAHEAGLENGEAKGKVASEGGHDNVGDSDVISVKLDVTSTSVHTSGE
jgi:hypothetical protein